MSTDIGGRVVVDGDVDEEEEGEQSAFTIGTTAGTNLAY